MARWKLKRPTSVGRWRSRRACWTSASNLGALTPPALVLSAATLALVAVGSGEAGDTMVGQVVWVRFHCVDHSRAR
eukprot:2369560-Prymnesium_polylepis.1